MIVGRKLGSCKKCTVWRVQARTYLPYFERVLAELTDALDHIMAGNGQHVGRAVISMSFKLGKDSPDWRVRRCRKSSPIVALPEAPAPPLSR